MKQTKRDTIKSLAKEIHERWPMLTVIVKQGYCNTDRKVGRLRIPGKGRKGSHIQVYAWSTEVGKLGERLLNHNNAETYRCTAEVRQWMECYALDHMLLNPPKANAALKAAFAMNKS